MKVNRERLAATFTELCEISSPSRQERNVADHLIKVFTELGADSIYEDNSAAKTGSNAGNLIITFNGTAGSESGPLLLACHMDTVTPADNVKVKRIGDTFTSAGDTILGSDDKSGIAAIIEMIMMLQDDKGQHTGLEIVLTTCEEVGLLGAKHLEHDKLKAKFGFALDSYDVTKVITKAPAANTIEIAVHGLAAHSGLNPEKGINAFSIAAKAVAELKLGRLDDESTSNLGVISGGIARNIVPDLITMKGEVRSHSEEKLTAYTDKIAATFNKTVDNWSNPDLEGDNKPSVTINVQREYNALSLTEESPVIKCLAQIDTIDGTQLEQAASGGGSDANVISEYGIDMAILGTGMQKVHTTDEFIELDDMETATALIYKLAITNG